MEAPQRPRLDRLCNSSIGCAARFVLVGRLRIKQRLTQPTRLRLRLCRGEYEPRNRNHITFLWFPLPQRPVVRAEAQPVIDEKLQVVEVNVAIGIEVCRQVGTAFKPVIGEQ